MDFISERNKSRNPLIFINKHGGNINDLEVILNKGITFFDYDRNDYLNVLWFEYDIRMTKRFILSEDKIKFMKTYSKFIPTLIMTLYYGKVYDQLNFVLRFIICRYDIKTFFSENDIDIEFNSIESLCEDLRVVEGVSFVNKYLLISKNREAFLYDDFRVIYTNVKKIRTNSEFAVILLENGKVCILSSKEEKPNKLLEKIGNESLRVVDIECCEGCVACLFENSSLIYYQNHHVTLGSLNEVLKLYSSSDCIFSVGNNGITERFKNGKIKRLYSGIPEIRYGIKFKYVFKDSKITIYKKYKILEKNGIMFSFNGDEYIFANSRNKIISNRIDYTVKNIKINNVFCGRKVKIAFCDRQMFIFYKNKIRTFSNKYSILDIVESNNEILIIRKNGVMSTLNL